MPYFDQSWIITQMGAPEGIALIMRLIVSLSSHNRQRTFFTIIVCSIFGYWFSKTRARHNSIPALAQAKSLIMNMFSGCCCFDVFKEFVEFFVLHLELNYKTQNLI